MAQYIATLADFNLELRHLPGIKNRADLLSQRPDYDDGLNDNEQVMALPDNLFIRMIKTMVLDQQIRNKQGLEVIEQWGHFWLKKYDGAWWKDLELVVMKPEVFAKDILETYHDGMTAGHLGIY